MILRFKGGPGSGHYRHAGRPGKRGGSLPGKGGGGIATHVKKVLKVAYKGEMVEPNRNELGVITNMLERHPDKVVRHLEGMVLCGSEEDWKEQYDKYFDDEGGHASCGGFYVPAEKSIYLPPGFSEHAINHEMGHVAYRAAWVSGGTERWDKEYARSDFDRHTAYSRTDANEAFAESYASYIASGGGAAMATSIGPYAPSVLQRYLETFAAVEEVVDAIP